MSKLFQILLRTQKEFQLGRFFDNQLVSKKIRICELGCDWRYSECPAKNLIEVRFREIQNLTYFCFLKIKSWNFEFSHQSKYLGNHLLNRQTICYNIISPVSEIKLPVPPFLCAPLYFWFWARVPPPLLDPAAARNRHRRRLSAPRYTYWLNWLRDRLWAAAFWTPG